MEFKKLEIKDETSWLRRVVKSNQVRRTVIFAVLGAVGGFLYFYFTEGRNMDLLAGGDIFRSMLVGGLFGIFITNSPCAGGRC